MKKDAVVINNVAVAECGTYDSAEVREALEAIVEAAGGLEWVQPGMKIGIKLNLCAAQKPEAAATTHPVLAAELTKMLIEKGAKVILGDSPGGPFVNKYINKIYNSTGLRLCEEAGGELNMNLESMEAEFPEAKSIKTFAYCKWLDECDAVINFCKLKSHGLMGITSAVKNLYGVIPGTYKSEYHFIHTDPLDFANMLVDLNEYVKPVMCFCDAVEIMEGNGPTQGTPRPMGLMMASKSPYELDRICAYLLKVKESEIPYMVAALERGLIGEYNVPADNELLNRYCVNDFVRSGATASWFIRTDKDKGVKKYLKRGLYVLMRSKPACLGDCTGCGHCAKGCPADAIVIKRGRAHIIRKKCVRCFCCQEFCPVGAMKVKRSPIARLLGK